MVDDSRSESLELLSASPRREAAWPLDQHCARAPTARTLMGQGAESPTFYEYLSETSVTDVQALAQGLPTEDFALFSGLSLGRCIDAPLQA